MRCLGVLTLAALLAAPAIAGEPAAPAPVTISGFVDAGWAGNFDRRDDAFGLNQVEIDLTRRQGDDLVLRADLEWVRSDAGEAWQPAAEQGFLAWRPAFCRPVLLTVGRFNAPIGWELPDPPDMQQASHGLLFTYATPTNLTGAMVAGNLSPALDLKAYLVNGWDQNRDPNRGKTVGGRLGATWTGRGSLGLSVIRGQEDDPSSRHTVIDVDLTLTPTERIVIGAEFNRGSVARGPNAPQDATWAGGMLAVRVRAARGFWLTGRVDTLDDADDHLFAQGAPVRRHSFTFAPALDLGEGLRALAEVRHDTADGQVFTDHAGASRDATTSGALTLTCSF